MPVTTATTPARHAARHKNDEVAPGFDDSDHYTAYLMQGGLMLPDREYYLSGGAEMRVIFSKYQQHVASVLKQTGFEDTDKRAARIVALEHSIAQAHWSLADSNDIHKTNNTWKRADFAANAPGLDWTEYFRAAGLDKQAAFIVWQPGAFAGESALIASAPLEDWKDWLTYHTIEQYAGILPKAFADERFAFWGKTLNGVSQQLPRWRRGVRWRARQRVGPPVCQALLSARGKSANTGNGHEPDRRISQSSQQPHLDGSRDQV
jgi:endothelin-converting enzyme/putative endopeptidase